MAEVNLGLRQAIEALKHKGETALGIDWGQEHDRSVITITTTGTTDTPPYRIWDMGAPDGVYVMPEQRYTYRRVRDMYGRETYERVPFNPEAPILEPPVVLPRPPGVLNGEHPGMGSIVVDELLRRTQEAADRRLAAELAERLPKEPAKPAPDLTKPRRVIEP